MRAHPHSADQMTPVERKKALEEGRDFDRYLAVLFMSEFKCLFTGIGVWDFWHDPVKMAEAELRVFERFGQDRIVIGPNTRGIAEALGAEYVYPENGVPYAGRPKLSDYGMLEGMEPVDAKSNPRIRDFARAAELLMEAAGEIVPGLVTGFSVYLARQFISDVPDSICEAAKIDGAGPFRIYWNIILPNIRPAIGSIGIFTAMMQWNDYLNPLLMLNDIEKMTMPLGLVIFNSQRTSDLAATMAAATMIMMPMILIFIIFQKQFIKGMTMSGIK